MIDPSSESSTPCLYCGKPVFYTCIFEWICDDCDRAHCTHESFFEIEGLKFCQKCSRPESDLIREKLEG